MNRIILELMDGQQEKYLLNGQPQTLFVPISLLYETNSLI